MAKSFKTNVNSFMNGQTAPKETPDITATKQTKAGKKTSPEAPVPSEAAAGNQSDKSPVTKAKPEEKAKKKGGRPRRSYPVKHINIAVPTDYMEKINVAKACYGNDLTRYINTLIKKDLEENYQEYQAYNDTINKFNVF